MKTEDYGFEVTGAFSIDKKLKPELGASGDITRFKLPDGRTARLVVGIEIESKKGDKYEYITEETKMDKLGFTCLDYATVRFTA